MTAPKPDPLLVDEADIARRLCITAGEWAGNAVVLERHGVPPKDALFGRRYWPEGLPRSPRRLDGRGPARAA